ncbi:hypothetical protein Amn_53500 [Aminobacter sp. Y103A]|jgi:hypothetical protein|uniref:Permease n=1 Tax=Aminobacter aminovorans TaxID=83263 RepID=A0AAC8YK56_AMIAI|nr:MULTISPECIES: hypothetical protein [Aminobacter]AMS39817.1 hypothetical protein AA2016_0879 [Aminobacter aminovorans]MBB3707105.1 hypothetical protein [Aminobacter aminovorans]QOF69221.1 permease [Aminobacter sp. SR38]BBD40470.1 hypothetical protein Amn_53500 [Aminobacter sp. SS-2016]
MDFMRLLKSIEELLYEVVSWLLFYPLTMWRALRDPDKMMRYANVELSDDVDEQYQDTMSPPMFLLLTLLIVHGLELGFISDRSWVAPSMLASDSNLLIFRAVVFSVFPLLMAVKLLRFRGARIDRATLKPPFYSQCYVAAPFALGVSLAGVVWRVHNSTASVAALLLLVVAVVWYVAVETRWFARNLDLGLGRALLSVVVSVLQGVAAMLIVGTAIALTQAPGT